MKRIHDASRAHTRTIASFRGAAAVLTMLLCGGLLPAQDRWGGSTTDRTRELGIAASSLGWPGSDWLGGASGKPREWRLGIRGDNTATGVMVREVTPGSAAAQARIEATDLIVNVGGFQVGMVDGRLYDLAEEINRRADASGLVSLIVQDHRTGRIASVRVKLDGSEDTLRGTIAYRDRVPLPRDAVVTVSIENLSRPHYQVNQRNNSFPWIAAGDIPFEVAYDAKYIDPADIYQVRATVTSNGRTILNTAQPKRVITRGNPKQVSLELVALENVATNATTVSAVTAGYPNYNEVNDQITAIYRRYLGRAPQNLELVAWSGSPNIAQQLATMPIYLMASQEYYDRVGNNSAVWIRQVYQEIVGRPATQEALDQWLIRYAELRNSRTELLRQLQLAAVGTR